jgi:hypothetical protein
MNNTSAITKCMGPSPPKYITLHIGSILGSGLLSDMYVVLLYAELGGFLGQTAVKSSTPCSTVLFFQSAANLAPPNVRKSLLRPYSDDGKSNDSSCNITCCYTRNHLEVDICISLCCLVYQTTIILVATSVVNS